MTQKYGKDQGFSSLLHDLRPLLPSCSWWLPGFPTSHGATGRSPERYCVVSGSVSQLRNTELRELQLYVSTASKPAQFLPSYNPGCTQVFPLSCRDSLSLSSQNVQHINKLESIVKKKTCHKNFQQCHGGLFPYRDMVGAVVIAYFCWLPCPRHWAKPIISSNTHYNSRGKPLLILICI